MTKKPIAAMQNDLTFRSVRKRCSDPVCEFAIGVDLDFAAGMTTGAGLRAALPSVSLDPKLRRSATGLSGAACILSLSIGCSSQTFSPKLRGDEVLAACYWRHPDRRSAMRLVDSIPNATRTPQSALQMPHFDLWQRPAKISKCGHVHLTTLVLSTDY
eukprot:m.264068 g.264068  ORF g.264068 m.264068 type:complete len:158 (-) comp16021_c0_seq1:7-480(-)